MNAICWRNTAVNLKPLRTLVRYSFLLINIALACLLFLCRYIPRINPFDQPAVGLLSYLVPLLVMANVVYFFIWLLMRKYVYSLVPLVAVLASWGVWHSLVAVNRTGSIEGKVSSPAFSVMSYNVRLLDLYNWSGKTGTRDSILLFFKQQQPDLLCLQEFYTGNDSMGVNNIEAIAQAGKYPYWHLLVTDENRRGRWGSIVFSKHPIVSRKEHDIDVQGSNQLQQTDIALPHDTVSLFNIHLRSNRFSHEESGLVEQPNDFTPENDTLMNRSRRILGKLFRTSIHRGLEARLMANVLQHARHPIVVCGDLNDIPTSYVYFQIRGELNDAFLEGGLGLGATYIKTLPLLRIDYIFHPATYRLNAFKRFDVPYSDHRPIMASLQVL